MMKTLLLLLTLIPAVCAAEAAAAPAGNAAVEGNNEFAADLYAQLDSAAGNLFFSPFSISAALAMTYAGAAGDTAAEMQKTLHFSLGQSALHPAMAELIGKLNAGGADGGYQLSVANALWLQKDYVLLDSFSGLVKKNYGAGMEQLDFKTETEAARQKINDWTSDHTAHKINDLLPAGSITPLMRLVLTNAVYFKDKWFIPFKKEGSENEAFTHVDNLFTRADHTKINTPLMHVSGEFNYLRGDRFQILELPYKGKDLSMIVFLPDTPDGLAAFEKTLAATNIAKWLPALHPESEVIVTLPKFKLTQQFSLPGTLKAMGMVQAFNVGTADFSGIDGQKDLFISDVIHKAYVDVDEEGTEAAAATAAATLGMEAKEFNPQPPPPIIFRADHPFVFLIRDNASGSILFMGRVSDPSSQP